CFYSILEFFYAKGLAHIVVSARLKTPQPVAGKTFCREKDNGHLSVVPSYLSSHRKPIALGQHHIQDAKIIVAVMKRCQAFFSIEIVGHAPPMCCEAIPDQKTKTFVVFYQNYPGGCIHVDPFTWAKKCSLLCLCLLRSVV